jgi:hypothetical protein
MPCLFTHQLYPPHRRKITEDAVEPFNSDWLLPPKEGEVSNSRHAYLTRPRGGNGLSRRNLTINSKRSMTGAKAAKQAADKAEGAATRPTPPQ